MADEKVKDEPKRALDPGTGPPNEPQADGPQLRGQSYACSATLCQEDNLDDEDDMDLTEKPPDDPKQQPKASNTGDIDKTALLYRAVMAELDQNITNLVRAANAPAFQK